MARMQRSLFAQLNALAEEINGGAEKSAAQKKVAGPTPADPGGYQGASSHPSTSVDNDVQSASTGARASEYEADIKKQQGAPAVDNTPEMSQEGRQDEVQLNINTNAKATGEDPAAEHDYKGDKDDPGTSHPAKTNDGEKYSHVSFKEARDRCSNLGNDILAHLINFGGNKVKAADELKGDQHKLDVDNDGKIEGSDLAALRSGEKSESHCDDDDDDKKEAAYRAGYELAAALGVEKQAAEAAVRDVCANTLREADEMADLFIGFANEKSAGEDPMEEAAEGESHEHGDTGSGASDAAPPVDMGDMMGGAGPEAGLDAAPPGEDEALQELAMALEELGISPEELLQMVQGGAGGDPAAAMGGDPAAAMGGDPAAAMGGDPAAAMGGAPAPGMDAKVAAAHDAHMIATAVKNFRMSGHFQVKEARTKRSRQLRDIMKTHIRELVSR